MVAWTEAAAGAGMEPAGGRGGWGSGMFDGVGAGADGDGGGTATAAVDDSAPLTVPLTAGKLAL